jgi:hypothetical protein
VERAIILCIFPEKSAVSLCVYPDSALERNKAGISLDFWVGLLEKALLLNAEEKLRQSMGKKSRQYAN